MIDAFDEIGSAEDRKDALEILTKRAHELPDGLRIVVTSRFERDIQDALQLPEAAGVGYMLMEDIRNDLTVRDIAVYVQDALKSVEGLTSAQLAELATAAGDSFQWASTACRYIHDDNDGQGAQLPPKRLFAGNQRLDELYARILDERYGKGSPDHLARLKLVLGQVVGIKEPRSLRAHWELTPQNLPAPYSDNIPKDSESRAVSYESLLASGILQDSECETSPPAAPVSDISSNLLSEIPPTERTWFAASDVSTLLERGTSWVEAEATLTRSAPDERVGSNAVIFPSQLSEVCGLVGRSIDSLRGNEAAEIGSKLHSVRSCFTAGNIDPDLNLSVVSEKLPIESG